MLALFSSSDILISSSDSLNLDITNIIPVQVISIRGSCEEYEYMYIYIIYIISKPTMEETFDFSNFGTLYDISDYLFRSKEIDSNGKNRDSSGDHAGLESAITNLDIHADFDGARCPSLS